MQQGGGSKQDYVKTSRQSILHSSEGHKQFRNFLPPDDKVGTLFNFEDS